MFSHKDLSICIAEISPQAEKEIATVILKYYELGQLRFTHHIVDGSPEFASYLVIRFHSRDDVKLCKEEFLKGLSCLAFWEL